AEQRVSAAGLSNVRFVLAGVGEGRLESDFFDRAVLSGVLGEIANPEAGLAEIYRALKPGGILSVTEALPDPHHQRKERVRQLAGTAGFVEQGYFGNALVFTMNLVKPHRPPSA